eukprot:scaffold6889_cov157-Amphora_coffeaeformis.AAC.2
MQTDRHTLARQGFEFTGGLGGGQPRRDGFPHARLQGGRRTRGTPRRRDQPFGRFPKGCHVRLHHSLHIGGQVGSNNELGQGLAKGLSVWRVNSNCARKALVICVAIALPPVGAACLH